MPNDDLRKQLEKQERQKEFDRKKNEMYARLMAEYKERLASHTVDRQPVIADLQEKIKEQAHRDKTEGVSAVDTVASIVSHMAGHCILIHSLFVEIRKQNFDDPIKLAMTGAGMGITTSLAKGVGYFKLAITDTAIHTLGLNDKYIIPELKYFTSLNKKDELEISKLGNIIHKGNGEPLNVAGQDDANRENIIKWIQSCGCTVKENDTQNAYIIEKDGSKLNPDEYAKMRDDKQKGLGRFLEETYGMPFSKAENDPTEEPTRAPSI